MLFYSNLRATLVYLEYGYKVFQKYHVSFWLEKCDSVKERIEYVGHDVTEDVICPTQSKFDLINDWKSPTNGQDLFSLIGLVNLYHIYAPYFETYMKPLHKLLKRFYRKPIPLMAWKPELIELFNELKKGVTSSPVLARFDPYKPTFLKNYWSELRKE